jgi:cytochrome P450 family 110
MQPLPPPVPISLLDKWQLVSQPLNFVKRLRQRHGDVAVLSISGDLFIMLLTSEGAAQALSADPSGYEAFWKAGFTGLAGSGSLWVLDGERHRRERQLLMPAFHTRGFRGYGDAMRQAARRHADQWRPGQTVRALDTTLDISLDVILRLVFGLPDGGLMDDGRRVLRCLFRRMHPVIVFFPNMQRGWFPLWARYARARAEFDHWVNRCLAQRRAQSAHGEDVLGRMLTARYDDGSPLRDADIRDELITILLAGHETTATALAWSLYELGRHPDALRELRVELAALGPDLDPDQVVRLPFLSAVCNETLRLHTLLPEVARVLTAPLDVLGRRLPAGASVSVSVMAIHHDPALYPRPEHFEPRRFIERSYSPFEFLPFGGGHRRCLGAALSDYEMRISLAEIVSAWSFEPARVERDIRHDIAMGPKTGVPLRITARRNPGPRPG